MRQSSESISTTDDLTQQKLNNYKERGMNLLNRTEVSEKEIRIIPRDEQWFSWSFRYINFYFYTLSSNSSFKWFNIQKRKKEYNRNY